MTKGNDKRYGRKWEGVKPPTSHRSQGRDYKTSEQSLAAGSELYNGMACLERIPELSQAPKNIKPSPQAPEEEAESTLGI